MRELVLFLLFLVVTCDGVYVKIKECKKAKSCTYKFSSAAKIIGGQEIDVTASVDILCESIGKFEGELSVRHCMNVRDAVAQIFDENKRGTNDVVPIKKLDKWFCFAQSLNSGKVLAVFHTKEEKDWVVNFKKSIASAFQVNYKGTTVVNETDSQSKHKSHYKYYDEGNLQIQERTVDTGDVMTFAGKFKGSKKTLSFHEHDKIELDSDKRVRFTEGKTILELGRKEKIPLTSKNGDVPALGATSDYKLELSSCFVEPNNSNHVGKLSIMLSTQDHVVDDLMATTDEDKLETDEMLRLNNELPTYDKTFSIVQRDTDSQETMQLMDNWRTLLQLESKNGALPGTRAKLPQLLEKLHEIKTYQSSSDERVFIYHLLSSEGSLESQQALLDMLETPLTSSETASLLVEIALLPAVNPSTVDSLISHYESLKSNDYVASQLLLSIGTLGRHDNVKEKVVNYLSVKLASVTTVEETSLLIHALGNTASKAIIPTIFPFLSDPLYQTYAIDALRAVSTDDRVEEEFAHIVSQSHYAQTVIEVVESLLFPFKHSIYSSEIEEDIIVSEELKTSLIKAGTKYNDDELTKYLEQYFTAIEDETSSKRLEEDLEESIAAGDREKRASTTTWNSNSDSNYNLVSSHGSRSNDVKNYPIYRAYLWAKEIGISDIHADVAAGGFGGLGTSGAKLYARGKLDLVFWSKRHTAIDESFSFVRAFPKFKNKLTIKRRVKMVGTTLFNEHRSTTHNFNQVRSWYKSIRIFKKKFTFFIYVGFLDLTISSNIKGNMKIGASVPRFETGKNINAKAYLEAGPSLSVSGSASATILAVYKVGLEVSASISYLITPKASASLCSTYDASACFEVFSTTAVKISVRSYSRNRYVSCSWTGCRIKWTNKRTYHPLSYSKNIGSIKKKLYGACLTYDCYGKHPVNLLCGGSQHGSSSCKYRYG